MKAYFFIIESIPLTILSFAVIALLSTIIFKSTVIVRSILFSNGIWLSPIYYLLCIFNFDEFKPEILLALLVELICLYFYLKLFTKLLHETTYCKHETVMQLKVWLKLIIVLYLFAYVPLLFDQGYGLFSEGSRIQYLQDSHLNIYSTYFCFMLSNVGVVLSAAMFNSTNKWDYTSLIFLFMAFLSSIISGSKGSFIVMSISLISLIQLPRIRDYLKLLAVFSMAILGAIIATVIFVGNFMMLDSMEMINLMVYRLFLVNDARALSIDFAEKLNSGGANLFQESFRGLYSLLGSPSIHPPLGQLLYQMAFATSNLSGANTSSTALLLSYGDLTDKALFAICLFTLAFIIFWVSNKNSEYLVPKLAAGILMVIDLSQDFLAFPLLIIIIATFIPAYLLISGFIRKVSKRYLTSESAAVSLIDPHNQL